MLKIILCLLAAIIYLVRFVDSIIDAKHKKRIWHNFVKLNIWLDYNRPIDNLALKLNKLSIKYFALFISIVLFIYIGGILFTPGVIKKLHDLGILTIMNVLVFLIGILISGWTCTRILAPRILEKKYLELSAIIVVSLAIYFITKHIVIKEPAIMSLILKGEVLHNGRKLNITELVMVNIISAIYGCLLWVAITSILVLSVFIIITILFVLLSWMLIFINKLFWLIISSKKWIVNLFITISLLYGFVDVLVKYNNAKDEIKANGIVFPQMPRDSTANSK